jgi:protein-histidine N-methyltransferase
LPPLLSYSPIKIPLSDGELVLPRRDLFDARFQLISQAADDKNIDGLEYLEAPSDLVSGIYEGGLKTWECSLDLVDVLNDVHGQDASPLPGKSVLEVR